MLSHDSKIFIAGARGMVGSALVNKFRAEGYNHLFCPSREELNLLSQEEVRSYLRKEHPDVIVIAAARVGGIWANKQYPADFLYENLMIASNLIHEAHQCNISRLLYLGSTCIYPKLASQPIREESLLSGPLEATNEAYAIAKIAGLKLCQYYREQYGRKYIAAMPTNLYGPGDTYHDENSHVIPALILRFHEAKVKGSPEVVLWGTGNPLREFLYVDDLAEALLFLLNEYDDSLPINVGSRDEVSIRELSQIISNIVDFKGATLWDLSKPDGTPRKKTDLSRITGLGWEARTSLKEGLRLTYKEFTEKFIK